MSTDNNLPINEFEKTQISDLADGLLRGSAFADAMSLLNSSSQARAYWHGLHVAGDVLRGEASANTVNTAKDMAFLDTFRANLAKESPLKAVAQVNAVHDAKVRVAVPTANDSFFNWKWVGGLSAAAAVVAFSWNLVSNTAASPNGAGAQLAQSAPQAAPVVTQTSAGAMLRNPQLDALIAAHNQAGGSSALQMPSGFLRSATFNTSAPVTIVSDK
jgi:sigma-E factor negative regulatory protein RseA